MLVGEDPASAVYVRSKNRATAEAGMVSFAHNLPDTTSEDELLQLVDRPQCRRARRRHPRPASVAARRSTRTRVIETIDPAKDVDGFHPINAGRLATGLAVAGAVHAFRLPPSAEAGARRPNGLDAVVIGRSNIVGKPMAQLLLGESAR